MSGIPEINLQELSKAEGINQGVLSLVAAFDKFDIDKSGGIDVQELASALAYLDMDANSEQARAILAAYDSYPDQVIDIKEFTALVRDILLLKRYDKDKDGLLDVTELHEALHSLGLEIEKSMTAEMLRHL